MTQEKKDGLDAFRKWLTPILITIIGVMLSIIWNNNSQRSMEWKEAVESIKIGQHEMNKKMEAINTMQTALSNQGLRIDQLNEKVIDLKAQVEYYFRNDVLYKKAEQQIQRKY